MFKFCEINTMSRKWTKYTLKCFFLHRGWKLRVKAISFSLAREHIFSFIVFSIMLGITTKIRNSILKQPMDRFIFNYIFHLVIYQTKTWRYLAICMKTINTYLFVSVTLIFFSISSWILALEKFPFLGWRTLIWNQRLNLAHLWDVYCT